ncbi:MAG TPA: hypothetical protein VK789_15400 [Bryobacteraceae bacterium]|nr:hypothetical protein [Bryobacteraceae bacterium]
MLIAATLAAQEPSILTNHGEPIRIGYNCAEEDLQWAGMSCDDEPCPIYLELSAIAASERKILAAGNLHGASATLDSILLESDDEGATWKEAAKRIRGDVIDQLQFYDAQHAWAAGETQYPLARDPFVLVTTDGGASWAEHDIGEEGSSGSVQRIWFDSATHGEALIDGGKSAASGRYATWESNTGGSTWELRDANNKLTALKQAPVVAVNTDSRIHPSQDGKTWQIEKRQGEAWSPVASFLIEVASCKVVPGQTNEPKL